ncbi:hypothetical protein K432DRAFT_355638 [Lepidopterella palustris CBS 459.81]|uniref:SnoaL-like domain-containing protein n=1 Tax=Lepidopterella palustris CBS 459.81 TaxID=1314670 RepID=A0A8E2JEH8_9PEZI|nr:hypothetical protein K432DRAFT_355638 [Lepidopterella palustris CBS 459.81]
MSTDTVWPAGFPTPVKDVILLFFSLADDKSSTAGPRLADEVFTPTGLMKNGAAKFEGTAEISKSREKAWDAYESRKHSVIKVFTHGDKADDLVVLGSLDAGFKNGKSAVGGFCVRIKVEGAEGSKPRLGLYEVFADHGPFVAAMKA